MDTRKVEDQELDRSNVKGDDNPADMMTKYLAASIIENNMEKINQEFRDGRDKASLKTN